MVDGWVLGFLMARPDFEDLEVYQLAEKLANEIWQIVKEWDNFTKDTVGKQIVLAADSVCANIALCRGRYNHQDNRRFVKIARRSLDETIRRLRLAHARQLLTIEQLNRLIPILDDLSPKLNAHLQLFSSK